MNEDQFWDLIDRSLEGYIPDDYETSQAEQQDRLDALLEPLSVAEVWSFVEHYHARMDEANSLPRQGLWGVASDIGGGCSEDSFDDFRSWLISRGRAVFEAAVRDPQTVFAAADRAGVGDDTFFELFQYVGERKLREKEEEKNRG